MVKSGCTQRLVLVGKRQSLDIAYDAAIQRACGLLPGAGYPRGCFPPLETLTFALRGERLASMSNGAAPAAMALDELFRRRKLPASSDELGTTHGLVTCRMIL